VALIELHGVERCYQLGESEVRALDGVSLAIEAGEYVAIMGQSGSGKSTLMNVLGCLDNPTAGRFLIDGRDVSTLGPDELAALRRERFGFIFQRYHLLPHLDARDNAALPAVYAGESVGRRATRAEALLARLGLSERMHHKPHELSGGQQQRVSIARALMNGGQIILADEPTGALDSRSGQEMLAVLRELNAAGHTIILVTHDAQVAAQARRLVELKDGRIVRDEATQQAATPAPATEPAAVAPLRDANWLRRTAVQWREALATAWLSLQGNRLRTALSMLGISIGIASVVSIVALTSSARTLFEGEFAGLMSGRLWVWRDPGKLPPGTPSSPFRPAELESLRALPGVAAIQAERRVQLVVRHRNRDASMQASGANADTLRDRQRKIAEGRFFTPYELASGAQVALIDKQALESVFRKGESPVGQTVLLTLQGAGLGGDFGAGGPGGTPAATPLPFLIIGVTESGSQLGFDFGSGRMLVPEQTLARKLDARSTVEAFSVLMDFKLPPQEVERQIQHRLASMRGQRDFSFWSGNDEYEQMQRVSAGFAALLAGVGAIALLVGGVGVMNIMLVTVSERTREIGIRMAVGARQGDIRLQFLIEAVVLCCLGGLAGVAFSWLAAQGLNAVQQTLQVQVSALALMLAFLISSGIGLVFGTLPARRAAALSPVDALARE
jgi:macrolide transport system ATP-binding/permease protein